MSSMILRHRCPSIGVGAGYVRGFSATGREELAASRRCDTADPLRSAGGARGWSRGAVDAGCVEADDRACFSAKHGPDVAELADGGSPARALRERACGLDFRPHRAFGKRQLSERLRGWRVSPLAGSVLPSRGTSASTSVAITSMSASMSAARRALA